MKSMTGYGYGENQDEKASVSTEIKAYNNRFLEISVSLPPFLSPLESRIRNYLASRSKRGRIDIFVRIKEYDAGSAVTVNKNTAKSYYEALKDLSSFLHIKKEVKLGDILGLEGVLRIETSRDTELYWELIEPALKEAAEKFDAERIREGEHTLSDILSHVDSLEASVRKVAAEGPFLENAIKENLRARFADLLGDSIDENRVLAETAVLLVKYSVSEELSRLSAHLKEFRGEASSNPSPGKKLDFLSQEINREINTLGSKSPVLDISKEVVRMKEALENIREQLRNIE